MKGERQKKEGKKRQNIGNSTNQRKKVGKRIRAQAMIEGDGGKRKERRWEGEERLRNPHCSEETAFHCIY